MTREARVFQGALLASLVLHALLLVLFITLPGGGPEEPVRIYTVRIMEAPARPQAEALDLSTRAISALKLEGPSLTADQPPLSEPEAPEVPAPERFPQAPPAPPAATPRPPAAAPPAAPAKTAPEPPGLAPSVGAPAPPRTALPSLPPALPPAAPPTPPRSPGARPAAPQTAAQPPALPQADEEPRQTAMDRLRTKVGTLNLEVEAAPPAGSQRPRPAEERNVLSFRVYSNRVREAVKEQYAFPGGFDASLRTRVRLVLNRDGSVRSTEIMDSSGNDRFDRLVCLGAFKKARIPAVPRALDPDADSLTLHFTCSP